MELDRLQAQTSILKDIWKGHIYPYLSFMDKQCLLAALNIQPETKFGKYKEEWFNPELSHEDKEDFIFRLYEICLLWDVEPTNINSYDKKQDLDIRAVFLAIVPPKFEYPCLVAFERIAKLVMKNEKEDIVINYRPCNHYSDMFHQKVPYSIELFQRFGDMGECSIIHYIFKTMDIEFYRFMVSKNIVVGKCASSAFMYRKREIEGKTPMEVDQICREIYRTDLIKDRNFPYHKTPNDAFGVSEHYHKYGRSSEIKGGERDINTLTEELQWLRSCGDYPNSECSLQFRTFEEIKLYIDCDGVVDAKFLQKVSRNNKCSYECIEYLYSIRKEIKEKERTSWDDIIYWLMRTCPENVNKAITMIHEMGFKKNSYPFYSLNVDIIPVLAENGFEFPFKRNSHDFILQLCKDKKIYGSEDVIETLIKCDLIDPETPIVDAQRVFSL